MLIPNCLHVRLLVGLNEMTKVPKLVPYWLVPGFDAKFDDLGIDGFQRFDVEVGEPREIAAQMHAQLGEVPGSGQPYFDLVYGAGTVGLKRLRDMIQDHAKVKESDIVLSDDADVDFDETVTFDQQQPESVEHATQEPSGGGEDGGDPLAGATAAKPGKPKGK